MPQLGIEECPTLRPLYIQPEHTAEVDDIGFGCEPGPGAVFGWDGVQTLLARHFSQIRNLTIAVSKLIIPAEYVLQSLRFVDWKWLEECILEHHPNLETLTFSFKLLANTSSRAQGAIYEDVREFVWRKLPQLVDRGLVRLRQTRFTEIIMVQYCY